MSTLYNGNPANVVGPAALNIASSTNTTSIQMTTSAPHGLLTNDVVDVVGHQVNTNANGIWPVAVSSSTSFFLVGSSGNGAGGATGNVQLVSRGAAGNLYSDGDAFNASSLNNGTVGTWDRTSFLLKNLGLAKLVGKVVIGWASLAEAAFAAGPTPASALTAGTAYPFINSPQTLTQQTMTQGAYGPLVLAPPYGFFGVTVLDMIRVSLQCGFRSNPAQTATRIALYYAMVAPGAAAPAFNTMIQVPYTSQSADLATGSAQMPVKLDGWIVAPSSGNLYLQPAYYTINNVGSAPTTTIEGDAIISIEGYRATGWPQ